eukprot:3866132-Rhodomonas_salina.2
MLQCVAVSSNIKHDLRYGRAFQQRLQSCEGLLSANGKHVKQIPDRSFLFDTAPPPPGPLRQRGTAAARTPQLSIGSRHRSIRKKRSQSCCPVLRSVVQLRGERGIATSLLYATGDAGARMKKGFNRLQHSKPI